MLFSPLLFIPMYRKCVVCIWVPIALASNLVRRQLILRVLTLKGKINICRKDISVQRKVTQFRVGDLVPKDNMLFLLKSKLPFVVIGREGIRILFLRLTIQTYANLFRSEAQCVGLYKVVAFLFPPKALLKVLLE